MNPTFNILPSNNTNSTYLLLICYFIISLSSDLSAILPENIIFPSITNAGVFITQSFAISIKSVTFLTFISSLSMFPRISYIHVFNMSQLLQPPPNTLISIIYILIYILLNFIINYYISLNLTL